MVRPERRRGMLTDADDVGVTIAFSTGTEHLAYGVIEQARTVFEWGPDARAGEAPAGTGRARGGRTPARRAKRVGAAS